MNWNKIKPVMAAEGVAGAGAVVEPGNELAKPDGEGKSTEGTGKVEAGEEVVSTVKAEAGEAEGSTEADPAPVKPAKEDWREARIRTLTAKLAEARQAKPAV